MLDISKASYVQWVCAKDNYINNFEELDFSKVQEDFTAWQDKLDFTVADELWMKKKFVNEKLKSNTFVETIVNNEKYEEWVMATAKQKQLDTSIEGLDETEAVSTEEITDLPYTTSEVVEIFVQDSGFTTGSSDFENTDEEAEAPSRESLIKMIIAESLPPISKNLEILKPEDLISPLEETCQMHSAIKWSINSFTKALNKMEEEAKAPYPSDKRKAVLLAEARKYSMQVKNLIDDWRRINSYDQTI